MTETPRRDEEGTNTLVCILGIEAVTKEALKVVSKDFNLSVAVVHQ